MKNSKIYTHSGKLTTKLEAPGAILMDYFIEDCYTQHVIEKGSSSLLGLYIKKGYVKIKSLFSHTWHKKDVSGTILYVYAHNNDVAYMNCKRIELDVPFQSWEYNHFKVELSEQGDILKLEYDEKLLEGMFKLGFEDALVNKPRKRLSGELLIVYSLGYNLCNRTDGDASVANLKQYLKESNETIKKR